jgi:hypothetical protein
VEILLFLLIRQGDLRAFEFSACLDLAGEPAVGPSLRGYVIELAKFRLAGSLKVREAVLLPHSNGRWRTPISRRTRQMDFSRSGKPTDNSFIESFNGKFRSECLNTHWFLSLDC